MENSVPTRSFWTLAIDPFLGLPGTLHYQHLLLLAQAWPSTPWRSNRESLVMKIHIYIYIYIYIYMLVRSAMYVQKMFVVCSLRFHRFGLLGCIEAVMGCRTQWTFCHLAFFSLLFVVPKRMLHIDILRRNGSDWRCMEAYILLVDQLYSPPYTYCGRGCGEVWALGVSTQYL